MADLNNAQADTLARFFLGDAINKFYDDPKNEEAYREWHLKKYGEYPTNKN